VVPTVPLDHGKIYPTGSGRYLRGPGIQGPSVPLCTCDNGSDGFPSGRAPSSMEDDSVPLFAGLQVLPRPTRLGCFGVHLGIPTRALGLASKGLGVILRVLRVPRVRGMVLGGQRSTPRHGLEGVSRTVGLDGRGARTTWGPFQVGGRLVAGGGAARGPRHAVCTIVEGASVLTKGRLRCRVSHTHTNPQSKIVGDAEGEGTTGSRARRGRGGIPALLLGCRCLFCSAV